LERVTDPRKGAVDVRLLTDKTSLSDLRGLSRFRDKANPAGLSLSVACDAVKRCSETVTLIGLAEWITSNRKFVRLGPGVVRSVISDSARSTVKLLYGIGVGVKGAVRDSSVSWG
jgi:hypothetical protein